MCKLLHSAVSMAAVVLERGEKKARKLNNTKLVIV